MGWLMARSYLPRAQASRQWAGFPRQKVALATMLVSRTTIIGAARALRGLSARRQHHRPDRVSTGNGSARAAQRIVLASTVGVCGERSCLCTAARPECHLV